jgi:hypothetical protein
MDRAPQLARAVFSMLSLLCALASATALAQLGTPNYQGLWYAAPAESQSGWGINVAHQGDVIYATWFTYGASSDPRWLAVTANKLPDGSFSGPLVQFVGSSYAAMPFNPSAVTDANFTLGAATFRFDSPTTGTVTYQPGATVIVQPITMQVFGLLPTCVWGAQPDLTKANNYTDLWWASPPGSESGWGINLTHQLNFIFATWFTYNSLGNAVWFSAQAAQTAPNTFMGPMYLTTGPAWGTLPWDVRAISYQTVGTATFVFADGNNATFTYNVSRAGMLIPPSFQIKDITRQVFRPPGTVCQYPIERG